MKTRIIYYHRLHFPSASGQTIQVIRDYHGMAAYHDVHLFYRAPRKIDAPTINSLLSEHGACLEASFTLHWIPEGLLGRYFFKRQLVTLIRTASLPSVIVTRTLDHAGHALKFAGNSVKTILELHETAIPHMIYDQQKRPIRSLISKLQEKRIFSRTSGLIATVNPQIEILDRLYPGHAPTMLLPNSFLAAEKSSAARPQKAFFSIRYAGQFTDWKNTDILFRALQLLPQKYKLELAGGKRGAEKETGQWVEKNCQQYGLADRVSYAGLLDPAQVPVFLAGADCLVLPLGDNLQSRLFTSPMKLFEYAASGTPMVVTDQPTTRSLVRHQQEALLVPPGSAELLAEAIQTIAGQPIMAGKLAQNARQWVEQFSPARRIEKYNHFLATTIFSPS